MKKTCTRCGEPKPVEMFYKRVFNSDGRDGMCKECYKNAVREYHHTEQGLATRRRASKKRRKNHPRKIKANKAVGYAIRDGKLKRPMYCCVDSSECGGRIEAHHWDYDRPLDVTWLCAKHHTWVHRQAPQGEKPEQSK